jgi:RNA polymerase sigma-70 factor (ECF subfamily)
LSTDSPADVTLAEIKRAFQELPEPFRIAVLLSDVEGLRYREIADALEIPVGTVMSRLSRGRQMLRAKLMTRSSNNDESSLERNKRSGRI